MDPTSRGLEAPNSPPAGLGVVRLLVVDDDPEMRRYVRLTVERASGGRAQVTVAGDGIAALELLAAERFDLLVADVRLPGLDGLALCDAMGGTSCNARTPVLLITGDPDVIARAGSFVAGRPDRELLAKPFNAARLLEALRRLAAPP